MIVSLRKITLFIIAILLTGTILTAQDKNDCKPLFSSLSNFKTEECTTLEFNELEILSTTKTGEEITEKKSGEYLKAAYSWTGDWEKRPSDLQILQNYANAIAKGGGQLLFKGNHNFCGKIKSNGSVYYIRVNSDGSGWYYFESVREAGMRQDVVMTPAEIRSGLQAEGKIAFYGIYFDTDKATIKPESSATLTAIAGFLKADPSISVFIVGHTDNTGGFEHNLTLSKSRADAVMNELATKYGVSKTQITAQGVASLAPVASNSTEDGKAKNRRVELVQK